MMNLTLQIIDDLSNGEEGEWPQDKSPMQVHGDKK